MNFALSSEQELLRDTARAVLHEYCPPSVVRAHLADPSAAEPLWERLREFTGLANGALVDLCLFLEETGAVVAPGPFFATTALFAPVVAALGDEELVEEVVAGDVTGTVALNGPVATNAIEADRVDLVAVITAGPAVRVVERPSVRVLETFDSSRRPTAIEVASLAGAERPIPRDALDGVVERATVAAAAEMVGTARGMLSETLGYVKVREQFGRPIGSFQALQHRLADMKVMFERAWSSVYWAAMTVDAFDPARHAAVHIAKASAGEAARHIAKEAIQMHGGIGYTWDHDLHLSVRRAYASERLLGVSGWHRDRLAELVLGP